ncbi:T9SS type A sorting domain-containing protein, partial [bacterium]|nr:T9SS type A sorting domain-containing protein [bacterium]
DVDSVAIAWPGGGTQTLGPMAGGRTYRFAEGEDPVPVTMNILTASPDSIAPPAGSLQVEVLNAGAQRVRGEEPYLSMISLNGLVTPGTPGLAADSTYTLPYTTLATGLDSLVVSDGVLADTVLVQITYFPDTVAIHPDAARIHWNETLPLGISIRNPFGARVPDQGTALSVTSLQGAGSLAAPVFQGDSTYAVDYTAISSMGVALDTLVVFDPEAASADRDTCFVELTDTAILSAVTDIPNDEGGQVRVLWRKDLHDTLGAGLPLDHYVVWRRVDGLAPLGRDAERHAVRFEPEGTLRALRALWEPVGPQIPAMLWDQYASVVPTVVDSTATGGIQYSVFLVSAHTTDPGTFAFSAPDSGYSVDNLAPVPPAALQLAGSMLSWEATPAGDFDHFACYGGPTPELEDAESLGATKRNGLDVSGTGHGWYFVIAVDVSGNASEPAVVENGATAVMPSGSLPAAFGLRAPNPNPFSGATSIGFDLPEPSFVRLSIYDVSGRLVRTLANETLPAGRHVRRWLGDSRAENVAMPGVYFVRLEAGRHTAVRKIVQIR